jgi:hypothetical protein
VEEVSIMKKQAIIQLKERYMLNASIDNAFDCNTFEKERPPFDLIGNLLFILGMNFLKVQRLKRPLSNGIKNPIDGLDEEAGKLLRKNGFFIEELVVLEFLNNQGSHEDLTRYLDQIESKYYD